MQKTLSKRGTRELKGVLRCLELASEKVDALHGQAESMEAEAESLKSRSANLRKLAEEISEENGRAVDETLKGLGLPADRRLLKEEVEDGCLVVSWEADAEERPVGPPEETPEPPEEE